MIKSMKFLLSTATGVSLLAAASLHAISVPVTAIDIGANETVVIHMSNYPDDYGAYAGVVKLDVNGVMRDGFCIDPWHWDTGATALYDMVPLLDAPKSVDGTTLNPMGAAAALQIAQLLKHYYRPNITDVNAAALQLEIWKIVDAAVSTGTFSLVSIDNDGADVVAAMGGMESYLTSNPNAPAANAVALTGRGQDYVIVPDIGSTALLLGLAMVGMVMMRRKSVGA